MHISSMDDSERCSKRRKTTFQHRKFSVMSTNLRSWKSLPDHLEDDAAISWPLDYNARIGPCDKNEHLTEDMKVKKHLCRAVSNAQIDYALVRKAIKERNRFDLLNLLNRKHDDINVLGADGLAALHHAAIAGTRKVIEMLFCFGAKINVKNADGDYPLDLAVRAGNYDIAQYLIEKGACMENVVNGTPPRKPKQRKMARSHTITGS